MKAGEEKESEVRRDEESRKKVNRRMGRSPWKAHVGKGRFVVRAQHAWTDGSFPFCGIQNWLPGCQIFQSSRIQLRRKEAPATARSCHFNHLHAQQVHNRKEGGGHYRSLRYFANRAGALRQEGTSGTSWQLTIYKQKQKKHLKRESSRMRTNNKRSSHGSASTLQSCRAQGDGMRASKDEPRRAGQGRF